MSKPIETGASALPAPEAVCAALPACCSELLLLAGPQGLLRWCNPALEALLGRSQSELVGAPLSQVLAGESAQSGPAAAGGPGGEIELDFAASDGRVVTLVGRVEPLADGDSLYLLRDLTETRLAQREAKRLAELLEMVQAFGRLGLWERDIATGSGTWDRHMFEFWGLDPARGAPSFEEAAAAIHPEDRGLLAQFQETTRSIGRHMRRYRVVRPDASVRWLHSQWEVKSGPDGRPARVVGVVLDDTEVFELGKSLSATHAQLDLAVSLSKTALWRHDLATDLVCFSAGAQEVFDFPGPTAELPLAALRSRVHPQDIARLTASAAAALAASGPVDIEARSSNRRGEWRTLLTRRVVERAADGRPLAFVGIALDITEQAEERRRSAEKMRRLDAAAAAAGIGVWSYDLETWEPHWNETMFELVGRPIELGAPRPRDFVAEIVHPLDRDALRRRAPREGAPVEVQYRVTLPDGTLRWLENRVRLESLDGRDTVFGVTLDITARRRADEALRDAAERAALAARGAGIGTWEKDLAGSGERWDEQMFRLRGLAPRPRPPTRDERLALLHPDDRALVLDSRPGDCAHPDPTRYEFRVRWPDGSWRWLASRSAPLYDDAGRAQRRVGVNWDITESKLAEAALRETAIAQRESQAKSQFLSRVSHELRTPLNAVLGYTDLLRTEARLAPPQAARLASIRTAAEHLLLMINDLLDLSGLAAGGIKLAPVAVDLAPVVRDALALVAPLAAANGIALHAEAIEARVRADPTRLRQVIVNLLTNAIKYNRRGEGEVGIAAAADGGQVALSVTDSGRGLAEEQLAHLFEPFNRLGAEREGIEGSGIGLVIVKALVEAMGGKVHASSRPAQGTTFVVELPAAAEAPPAAESRARRPPAASAGSVLCIEDNPVNLLLVQELLAQRPGVSLLTATTGRDGVRQARLRRPDLVLIDMQLPDFDGFEVLRRLRSDARSAALRCIALSANALPEDIARARDAGFDDYWTKPIVFDAFLEGIDAALAT